MRILPAMNAMSGALENPEPGAKSARVKKKNTCVVKSGGWMHAVMRL